MVENNESENVVPEEQNEKLDGILEADEFLPLLEQEALSRKLNVYVFENEELKKYYDVKHDCLGVALLASCEENAIHNLKNLRKCYLIKFK